MFSKLAIKNVKKSIKDYAVYFLTLMLGVCIFYVFNSIEAQGSMMEISESTSQAMRTLTLMINVVSAFVSCVLAFLILYANNFMIKRRKKELGIYMLLGTSKGKIAGMLIFETFLIGILALATGLLLGILLSQGLAVIVAKLFGVPIVNYQFVFSQAATMKSILYFGVIFIVVMLLGSRSVARTKLVDLLSADRKNEELKLRKKGTSIVLMIVGCILIAGSYFFVLGLGLSSLLILFAPALAINVAGSLLLFMSLSRLMLGAAQANEKRYFKGLNLFTTRQLGSKVNTNFVSMTFICTMLFLTIVILSSASSFNKVAFGNVAGMTPFDVSYTTTDADKPLGEMLAANGVDEADYTQTHEYAIYKTDVLLGEFETLISPYLSEEAAQKVSEQQADAIRISDYNRLREMKGEAPLVLAPNEYMLAFAADETGVVGDIQESIQLSGQTLIPTSTAVLPEWVWTSNFSYGGPVIVAPDALVENTQKWLKVFSGNYAADPWVMQSKIEGMREALEGSNIKFATKLDVTQSTNGLSTAIIFVGIYMGIVFLIAASAVLALQQLSDTSDSKKRYELLNKIGADRQMIHRSLLKQIALYFFIPLALAIVHAVVGVRVMTDAIMAIGFQDVFLQSLGIAAFIFVIYGGYYFATYSGCKRIVDANVER